MAAEAEAHGGQVVLAGGWWDGWWCWADEYAQIPDESPKRRGYVESDEWRENRVTNWNGISLRWYGPARVWRFDDALVSSGPEPPAPATDWRDHPRHCACGQRLLLAGRDRCERCRLGYPITSRVWQFEREAALSAGQEEARLERVRQEEQARIEEFGLFEPDHDAEPRSAAPTVEVAEPAPQLSAEDAAAFAWKHLAPLYDR